MHALGRMRARKEASIEECAPVRYTGFGQKKEKKGFFDWYFNSRKVKDPPPMARTAPMRIEPKTFFANERTFLSWLHMAVTLGSIAAALLALQELKALC